MAPTSAAVRRRSRPTLLAGAAGAVALLLALGCSDDGPSTGDDASTRAPTAVAGEPGGANLRSYASVVELAAALEEGGLGCALEYEGLRDGTKELSLCVIGDDQATLSIWFDRDELEAFRTARLGGRGSTVVGANWTIDIADADVAQRLADAAGGVVKQMEAETPDQGAGQPSGG